jgi:integrase
LCAITTEDVQWALSKRVELHGVATNTLRDDLRVLSRLFVVAQVSPNPCKGVEKPTYRHPRRDYFAPAEISRLIAKMRTMRGGHHAADIVTLLVGTGMRAYELDRLTTFDIVAQPDGTASLFVTGKVGGIRELRAHGPVAVAALRLLDYAGSKGYVCGANTLGTMLQRWSYRLREPRLNGRALRRTFATTLASGGTAVHEVQRLLGHQNLTMTRRYLGLGPAAQDKAAAMIAAAVFGDDPPPGG